MAQDKDEIDLFECRLVISITGRGYEQAVALATDVFNDALGDMSAALEGSGDVLGILVDGVSGDTAETLIEHYGEDDDEDIDEDVVPSRRLAGEVRLTASGYKDE